jgi:inosine-uridine nucleoside N-ribohydrolase
MITKVHGNSSLGSTTLNAARCLRAYGAPKTVKVYPGAAKPLIRPPQYAPAIHGSGGLGGVKGLPEADDPEVQGYIARTENDTAVTALEGLSDALKQASKDQHKITVVSSGPMTNIALFLSAYPNLLEGVEELVFMGGGVGMGNRSAVAGAIRSTFIIQP